MNIINDIISKCRDCLFYKITSGDYIIEQSQALGEIINKKYYKKCFLLEIKVDNTNIETIKNCNKRKENKCENF